jgi:ssDNA thymidine ADP-ribosyltransferase, DarT
VFSDASVSTFAQPNFYSDPAHLGELDWGEIDSIKSTSFADMSRYASMAEVLVHIQLRLEEAVRVVVWDEETKMQVETTVKKAGVPFPPIDLESRTRRHWFRDKEGHSLITGPRGIANAYVCLSEGRTKYQRTIGRRV